MDNIKKCCIVGVGIHASENLIPALLKLQKENLIEISHICRKNINEGDKGLKVPVTTEFPKCNIDFFVVCGHPQLHKKAIEFSNETNIPVFVEKPHLIEDLQMNDGIMIGYNFNFISPFIEKNFFDKFNFDKIICGTNGLYQNWNDLFPQKSKYYHAFHAIIVHPISIMINKYNMPEYIKCIDLSKNNDVIIEIFMFYKNNITKNITYSSKNDSFKLDFIANNMVVLNGKQYKADSYYNMLKYYVTNDFKPVINNHILGSKVLSIINMCLDTVGNDK